MAIQSLRSIWNRIWNTIEDAVIKCNSLAFVKIMLVALGMRILGRYPFSNVLLIGFALLFIVFYIYEKKETEIDNFIAGIKERVDRVSFSPRLHDVDNK